MSKSQVRKGMTNHRDNANQYYHFEDLPDFCDTDYIDKVYEMMTVNHRSIADTQQLTTIVKLEKARTMYAYCEIDHDEVIARSKRLRYNLLRDYNREPFDNGPIDEMFYNILNQLYGLS